MTKTRRKIDAVLKAKIALEALRKIAVEALWAGARGHFGFVRPLVRATRL